MRSDKGFIEIVVIAIVMVSVAAAGVYMYLSRQNDSSNQVTETPVSYDAEDDPATARDAVRAQHAITMASNLVSQGIVSDEPLSENQQGLDVLQNRGETDELQDPLTKKPYVYKANAANLAVGEATFSNTGTCDNKIEGSDGIGLIEPSSTSVAVTVKLEVGGYACQSSL